MFPTLSKWQDIFRSGFRRVWLWNVQNSWDLTRPRLSYTFLFFDFQKCCRSNWNVSHIIKVTGHFTIRLLTGPRLRSVQISCDMEFLSLFPVFDFSNFVFSCFPQASAELSGQWLYTIGPHFQQGSDY